MVLNHQDLAFTYNEVGYCRIIDIGPAGSRSLNMTELCDRIAWDENARVVVLIFGNEVSGAPSLNEEENEVSLVEPIARLKQPVIAAIRGDAIGLGLELALACDIRISVDTARFGMPQIQHGLMPSHGGTQRLPRLIGRGRAMHMILTGELIDAAEACRIGLIQKAVLSDSLAGTVMDMAGAMAAKSPLSLGYIKEALYAGGDLTLDQGLRMELDLYLLLFTASDRTEGITAFKENRKPVFKGN